MKQFFTKKNILIASFIFCFSIIVTRIITVPLYDSGKARDAIHGDAYSDKNAYSAALYFYDFGFSNTYYLPVLGYKGNKDLTGASVYTHYPALPDILAGTYAKIFDTKNDKLLRIIPVFISVAFFFFIFYFLKTLLPNQEAAFIGALALVLSNYFIFWGDNLHKHLYEEFLKWLYVFFLYIYYRDGKRKKWLIVLCGLIFVLATNISFEPVTYLAVITIGLSWIFDRKIFSWENILLGITPVIGFALHFYQNICLFNSFELAFADMASSATMRTVGDSSIQNEMKRSLSVIDYLDIPLMWMRRIERYFLIPGPAFAFLAYLGLKELKNQDKKLYGLGITLILATLSWNVAMTQHSIVHGFTTRHLGLLFGFVTGYGLLSYFQLLKSDWAGKLVYRKIIHIGFIGYIVVMLLSQQLVDIFRYGYLYSFFN